MSISRKKKRKKLLGVRSEASGVTLVDKRQARRFKVGDWVLLTVITELNVPADNTPLKPRKVEYRKVVAVNSALGRITFE